jgi:hypothetical protein
MPGLKRVLRKSARRKKAYLSGFYETAGGVKVVFGFFFIGVFAFVVVLVLMSEDSSRASIRTR